LSSIFLSFVFGAELNAATQEKGKKIDDKKMFRFRVATGNQINLLTPKLTRTARIKLTTSNSRDAPCRVERQVEVRLRELQSLVG
jgi:hypothetical protein